MSDAERREFEGCRYHERLGRSVVDDQCRSRDAADHRGAHGPGWEARLGRGSGASRGADRGGPPPAFTCREPSPGPRDDRSSWSDENFALDMHLRRIRLPEHGISTGRLRHGPDDGHERVRRCAAAVGSRPRRGIGRRPCRPRHESPSRPHRRRGRPCRACPALRRHPSEVRRGRRGGAGIRGSGAPAAALCPWPCARSCRVRCGSSAMRSTW